MNKIFISLFIFVIFLFNQILKLSANDDTYINSSNIIYNEKENVIELGEESKINFKDANFLVERGIIDYNKNKFEVFGNFYLYEDLNILSGENLRGDTNLDSFTANNVSFIYNDDLKIDSEKLIKENNLLYFENNFLTPCELKGYFNCPTWSLRIDKIEYDIDLDKFNHYDTFLQIADYKVFYLPYFSHYGTKAPRKKGFLTPQFAINFNEGLDLITPYYVPINDNSDLTIKPTFTIGNNLNEIEQYKQELKFNKKTSGGDYSFNIFNKLDKNNDNIYSSAKFNTSQVINKNNKLLINALITNSISTSRSINSNPITFEEIYLRLNSFDTLMKNDFIITEISTVGAFDNINNALIPFSPSLQYSNNLNFNNGNSLSNQLSFNILKRDQSDIGSPSEITNVEFENSFIKNTSYKSLKNYSKLKIYNGYSDYFFQHNPSLNFKIFDSHGYISNEVFYIRYKTITPRIKITHFFDNIKNSKSKINENSNSVTFNYQNIFSDNRLFGSDLNDNSTKIAYGLEINLNLHKNDYNNIFLGQSYDFKKRTNYLNKINQTDNFSDYVYEINSKLNIFDLSIDGRLDQSNFSKKEMNYNISINNPIFLELKYNETDKNSYKDLSTDVQSLNLYGSKKINNSLSTFFSSDFDLKRNYSPIEQSLGFAVQDDCSKLEIIYSNKRFNDSLNTVPEEKISFTYYMNYLGYLGFEQSTNLVD